MAFENIIGNNFIVSTEPKTEYAIIDSYINEEDGSVAFVFYVRGYKLKISKNDLLRLNPEIEKYI